MLFLKCLDKALSIRNRFEINSETFCEAPKTIALCLQQFLKQGLRIELDETRCNQ